MTKIKVLITDFEFKKSIYNSIIDELSSDFEFIKNTEIENFDDIDIVLLAHEFYFNKSRHNVEFIYKAKQKNIPVLLLMDGILEWRNSWENNLTLNKEGMGFPAYQPVLSDKVACLGANQIRILEHWGNLGKCELVGFPDYDKIPGKIETLKSKDIIRISIMTATTPYFNEKQKKVVEQSLVDVKRWIEKTKKIDNKIIKVHWRISKMIDDPQLVSHAGIFEGSLWEAFKNTDILISTPSTITLGAMLYDIPVITLDYTNSPQYIPPTWLLNHKDFIGKTIQEASDFSPQRKVLQDFILHDNLFTQESSAQRLKKLITQMVKLRKNKTPYPHQILDNPTNGYFNSASFLDYKKLYPYLNVFNKQQERYDLSKVENFHIAMKKEKQVMEDALLKDIIVYQKMTWKHILRGIIKKATNL